MKKSSLFGSRLSRYASLAAGGLGAAAHGDIQAYNIPILIPEGVGAQVNLSNAGLDFNMSLSNFAWTSSVQDGRAKTCCSSSSGGKNCYSYGMVGPVNNVTTGSVIASCFGNSLLVGVSWAAEGDLNSGGPWSTSDSGFCGFASQNWVVDQTRNYTCDGVTTQDADRFDPSFYLRFEVMDPKTADTYLGWMLLEPVDGTGGDFQITRWAFEDSGAPIVVGDGPEPVTCNKADINGDGKVDSADLGLLIAAWGECE